MEQILWYIACMIAPALVVGFVAGALVIRNNYKGMRAREDELRKLILDSNVTNNQVVLKIRNRLKI